MCLGRVLGRLEVSWGSLWLDFPSPKEPNSGIPSWVVFSIRFLFDFSSKNRSLNLQIDEFLLEKQLGFVFRLF